MGEIEKAVSSREEERDIDPEEKIKEENKRANEESKSEEDNDEG